MKITRNFLRQLRVIPSSCSTSTRNKKGFAMAEKNCYFVVLFEPFQDYFVFLLAQ